VCTTLYVYKFVDYDLSTYSLVGVSGKSQILFALTFTTRYLDVFVTFISFYNVIMKIIFIVLSYTTVYLIYVKFRASYGASNDSFRAEFIVVPAVGLAILLNHQLEPLEVCL